MSYMVYQYCLVSIKCPTLQLGRQHETCVLVQVPFRLTRMMINAMEVSGVEGNFRWVQCSPLSADMQQLTSTCPAIMLLKHC